MSMLFYTFVSLLFYIFLVPFALGNQPGVANDDRGIVGFIDEVRAFAARSDNQIMTRAMVERLMAELTTTIVPTTIVTTSTTAATTNWAGSWP